MHADIENLHTLYRLKEVERRGTVCDRQESAAEHTYSAMVLAAYFLPAVRPPLDEAKVLKLILMHDWVEVHSGDTFVFDEEMKATQEEREKTGAARLMEELPSDLAQEYRALHAEFDACTTREAKFAHAVEILDRAQHVQEGGLDGQRLHRGEAARQEGA